MARQVMNLGKLAEALDAADVALEAAALAAVMPREDRAAPFNTRLRLSSLASIEARAREDGVSLKLVMCRALEAYGVKMGAADLEDGSPRRRAA